MVAAAPPADHEPGDDEGDQHVGDVRDVAQSALDLGLRYAEDRVQFGKPLISFPRVADKLVLAPSLDGA